MRFRTTHCYSLSHSHSILTCLQDLQSQQSWIHSRTTQCYSLSHSQTQSQNLPQTAQEMEHSKPSPAQRIPWSGVRFHVSIWSEIMLTMNSVDFWPSYSCDRASSQNGIPSPEAGSHWKPKLARLLRYHHRSERDAFRGEKHRQDLCMVFTPNLPSAVG